MLKINRLKKIKSNFPVLVGDKVIEAMNGTGVPYKIFKTKFGYSRV